MAIRANLGWYPTVPFLEDMYGAVGGQLRNVAFQIPGSELRVEADEWQNARGKALNPRLQDSGASRLILSVRNLDKLAGYLKQGGAKVVTTGGAPVRSATLPERAAPSFSKTEVASS